MDEPAPPIDNETTSLAAGACPRCRGTHPPRQRCPADFAAPIEAPPEAAVVPDVAESIEQPSSIPAAVTPVVATSMLAANTRYERLVPTVAGPGISLRGTLRWLGATIGSITLLTCLIVAGAFVAQICQVDPSPERAIVVVAIAIAVGTAVGGGLMFVSARVYAKIVFAALSLVLIPLGFMMMVFAPVARQMNTPDLAEYRAFWALLLFGGLSLAAGLLLGSACLAWAARPHARARLARWSRVLGSIYGIYLGISGVALIFTLFRLIHASATYSNRGESSVVEQAISIAAIAMMTLVPGLILTYHGISASMGERTSEFRAPWALFGGALFGVVLLLGHLNMTSDDPVAGYMPVLHVLAAFLPGLTFAMLASRGSLIGGVRVRHLSWRQWTLAIALSMSVATAIAIYVESIGSAGAVVVLLVHSGAFEFARNWNGVTSTIGDADFILSRNEQFVAGLITACVLAPLSEEFGKSLSTRFMLRPMSTRAQAFALGGAAGAGFGFIEAMLYGLSGIQDDLGDWWLIMVLRGGSTSLHVMCAGLTGLAWWYWSIARRRRPAILLFATAVLFHASWNAAFTVIDSRIFGLETLSHGTLEKIAYAVVAIVSGAFIVAIPIVARRVREDAPGTVEGTPLAVMSPWLA